MGIKKRSKVSAEFNMSSLTDIIFLLLIFFMLTSSLVTPNALNLQLPGKKTSNSVSSKKGTVVSIRSSGTYYLNNNRISLEGLNNQFKKLKERSKKPAIVIRSSSRAPVDNVVAVMDLAWKYQIAAVMDETN